MKIISVEQKKRYWPASGKNQFQVLLGYPSKQRIPRVTIYHWFEQFEKDDSKWSEGNRRTSRHYSMQVRETVVQAYLEGNHTIDSLTASYGLRSELTVLNGVRDYQKAIGDGTPLIKRKGGKQHMEHRDIKSMTDREIKIENGFLRAYRDELLKEIPDTKRKDLQTRLEKRLPQSHCMPTPGKS